MAKWTEIWWEAPMEGSVLSFLKAEWKVSDTASSLFSTPHTKIILAAFPPRFYGFIRTPFPLYPKPKEDK